jgi:hypothetical protein
MRIFPRESWLALFLAAAALPAIAAEHVWWEAEGSHPEKTGLSAQSDRERAALSGGEWLTTAGQFGYDLRVPADGPYELWVRTSGPLPLRWRFDNGEWREPPKNAPIVDAEVLDIRGDRYFTVGWAKLADVTLKAGNHRFALEFNPPEKGTAALDCFALVRGPFKPYGKCRPGEKLGGAPDGWFAFEPDRDTFQASAIDLSRFNEPEAGSKGNIIRKGDRLVFEKTGEPVRFWGVTANDLWKMDRAEMDYLARRLAKMGVNCVRLHVAPYSETTPGPVTDGVHYFAAALKRNGIYSGFNWYCSAVSHVNESWGLPELENGSFPWQCHLFYEPLQKLYKSWARNLLGTKNPYTGLTLLEDPATAFVELVDEDNLFFYTFNPAKMPSKPRAALEKKFSGWCAERGLDPLPLYPAHLLGGQDWAVAQRDAKKAEAQVRFMVGLQREFYAGMKKWLQDEFGYRGLVIGTNWVTTDERVLGPLDKYSEFAADVTARNTYFGGDTGESKFFPWMVGMTYRDVSLLREPVQGLTMHVQYNDYPHFLTEGGYQTPNRFRTEEQLVMASYGSLQGIDGMFPFQLDADWLRALSKWPTQTPATMGQYPAAALIYRLGLVAEGPVVVREALKPDDLFALKGAASTQPTGLDAAQAVHVPNGVTNAPQSGLFDPMAFYAGRVVRWIADEPGETHLTPIDHKDKIVRSATGELVLDYGRGLLTVNTPQAQGATGFLREAGKIALDGLTIESGNEYGAVILVSLDQQPLAKSKRMFLQVMTEEKNNGWTTQDGKITDVGGRPIIVRNVSGTLSLKRPDADKLKVTALDANGYPVAPAGSAARLDLRPETLNYLIEK